MAHVLGPREYSDYAAGQMLLGIVGIAAADRGRGRRLGAGAVRDSPCLGMDAGRATFCAAVTTVAEVGIRLAFSVVAVLLGWGATGALTGFLAGATVVLLLRAWASACHELDGQLVIAGRGPNESRIRALANRLGVSDHGRFVGWVRGPEKHQLLSGSRLVVVPSRHKTFGIVAVEALAAATSVLAFDIPCLREVVPPGCGWRVHASTSPRSPPNSSLSIPIVIVCSPPDVRAGSSWPITTGIFLPDSRRGCTAPLCITRSTRRLQLDQFRPATSVTTLDRDVQPCRKDQVHDQ
jgi:hypothetical protein